jgi:hypothetical protein
VTVTKHLRPVLLILFVLGYGVGCGGDSIVWEAKASSPDGSRIASVRTLQGSGPGNASLYTIVYLQQNPSSVSPTEVLGFDCEHSQVARPYVLDLANSGGSIHLTMKWVGRSHLEVTYDNHPDLYFQVVKAFGVDISVRDLSNQVTKPE